MASIEDSGNERILAAAMARRWLEEARLPVIRAALAALPEANAADLLHEQGLIDSAQRARLLRQETGREREARGEALMDSWLREAAEQGASDLYLAPDHPPLCRRHGVLGQLAESWHPLSARQIEAIVDEILSLPGRESLARQGWASLIYDGSHLRTRLTVGRDAKGFFLAFRLPFSRALELDELRMEAASELVKIPSGLVILAGGSGQGKSALLAALARRICRSRPERLVVLEELPEYAWEEGGARIARIAFSDLTGEREEGLRAAFSLDPDILLLDASLTPGALRLLIEGTVRTGALVMATLGLRGVTEVLRLLCAEMPQGSVRSLLVRTLRAILATELVPGATGKERVAATELFRNVPAAAVALTEATLEQMEKALDAGGGKHFQPIDDSLWRLFQQGLITMEAAYARCRDRPRWVARMQAANPPGVS